MGIMEQKRQEMKKEFLALTPAQRIREMEFLFNEFVKLRAKRERITESEAYFRYVERTKESHKDKKLARLMKPRKIKIEKEDKDRLL
jgi:lipid A disaccharide synthetase